MYILLLRRLAIVRSECFFSEGRFSGMRTEAHAAGKFPGEGNPVGSIMQHEVRCLVQLATSLSLKSSCSSISRVMTCLDFSRI